MTTERASRVRSVPGTRSWMEVYDEQTFQWLFSIERSRAAGSGSVCLLVLVDQQDGGGSKSRIQSKWAARIVATLRRSLRETDCVGWYRSEWVVGAVVTELCHGQVDGVTRLIAHRVSEALGKQLPSEIADRLRVRVYQRGKSERCEGDDDGAPLLCMPVARQSLVDAWKVAVKRTVVGMVGL